MHTSEIDPSSNKHVGQAPEQARLHVSGVATPILTNVTRQSARGMTVEQDLPFLQLRTQVWDDAQKPSRIESVSVVVYDGVPRLVLDLAFDDVADDAACAEAVPEPRRAHAGVVRPRMGVDQTVSYEKAPAAAKAPQRESTQTFATQGQTPKPGKSVTELPAEVAGLKLSVMEQQLLQPKDFVFHVRVSWERAQPHVARAQREASRLAVLAYRWAYPRAVQALLSARALSLRVANNVAARVQARAALAASKGE